MGHPAAAQGGGAVQGDATSSAGSGDGSLYQKTVLDCGVRVLTETIPSVRSVSAGIWVRVGSRDEPDEKAGVSHLIEHMVFKGTKRRRMHQIARRLESVGGYLNAFTGKEYTCYYARALDEQVVRAIDTIVDLALNPVFPEKELAKEKEVVLEEMKMYEDSPEDVAFDRFERSVYTGHPFGRPIIGTPETVQELTRQDLIAYRARHYGPEHLVLSVAGNVDHKRVVSLAKQAFQNVDHAPAVNGRDRLAAYTPDFVRESKPIQQAHVVIGRRGVDINDPLRSALSILNTVLGGGMSSRLNQRIREKYGYCYHISSFLNMHSDTGDLGIYLATDPVRIPHATRLVFKELTQLRDKPVSERLLGQARSQVKGHLMLGLESMSNRMMRMARQELLLGRFLSLDEVLDEVNGVTRTDLQEAAERMYARDMFTVVELVPDEASP